MQVSGEMCAVVQEVVHQREIDIYPHTFDWTNTHGAKTDSSHCLRVLHSFKNLRCSHFFNILFDLRDYN